ncbi:Response regulator receiver:Metal-dependent phosphohydrolase HD domain protein [uncultured Sporomusa sp.]|uniref:Response regulator receiver:Metal-dependent phosphohydrolase HD domain protein n=1 Tax=uncultured Sporomusa sp. TaxID=307249 RepID=A0A212LU46_9FIRM|nr:HD domain-containing phosphohydrolase [uncultured Sporomusa sp.]SCM81027.1 Response regulator receiver:Metal-dependent phosphohydrolase HD domain protein [uncultured Sporomusa sp.]
MSDYTTDKATILVVDDMEVNRLILQEILADSYEIQQAADGLEAVTKLVTCVQKPQLVLLDIMMPEMDGFEVLRFMKTDPVLQKIPVIFITAANEETNEIRGLNAGAVDYIAKPFNPKVVRLRAATHIELMRYREKLEDLVDAKANELVATKEIFLETMANLIEYRSLESGEHVKRTRELTQLLIMELLKKQNYRQQLIDCDYSVLIKAVPLHDIGKIGIPDNILLKPGRLTPEEFAVIKTHTVIGSEIIKSLLVSGEDVYLNHCYDICRFHHERWDGNGYPANLAGTDIPLSARIVAVVDVYDALVSERCYKRAHTHEEALTIIRETSGTQFDPNIVNALLQIEDQFKRHSS